MFIKRRLIFIIALIAAGLLIFLLQNKDDQGIDETSKAPPIPENSSSADKPEPIGDQFLVDYADPSTPPREDLEKIGRAMESLLLLFKNLDTRFISTNSQLSEFLRGKNPEETIHVSTESPIFGDSGEIIDRWGTPIIVHPIGTGLIELRSAGPDRILYNEDDLVRGY